MDTIGETGGPNNRKGHRFLDANQQPSPLFSGEGKNPSQPLQPLDPGRIRRDWPSSIYQGSFIGMQYTPPDEPQLPITPTDGEESTDLSGKSISTPQFLLLHDKKTYQSLIQSKTSFLALNNEYTPQVIAALDTTKASYETKRDVLFGLAKIDFDSMSFYRRPIFLEKITALFQRIGEQGLTLDQLTANIILDSANQYQDIFISPLDNYADKLLRSSLAYVKSSYENISLPSVDPGNRIAVELTNEQASYISHTIARTVRERIGELILSPKSALIEIKGTRRQKKQITSDFFKTKEGTAFAHIGNLFFVSAEYKHLLPPEILEFASTNIIFIKDINKTELNDRLGYFTFNTLASLMDTNVAGSAVLDCGTGSGLLALAANRLGAKVVGIDYDEQSITRARENARENPIDTNQSLQFVHADLRDIDTVISHFTQFPPGGNIIILSNIGSWSNYPISNLTSYAYIPALQRISDLSVGTVISGGYMYLEKEEYPYENDFLQQIGFSRKGVPTNDQEFDTKVLSQLGYSRFLTTESETFREAEGTFERIAQSTVSIRVGN